MKTNPDDLINQPKKYSESIKRDGLECFSGGLTKREYFAALILQGIKASTPGCFQQDCSQFAVEQADSLIEQLNKETT